MQVEAEEIEHMRRNEHQWGVVAQDRGHDGEYREFQFCPLCGRYQETALPGYLPKSSIPRTATQPDSALPFWLLP